MKVKI